MECGDNIDGANDNRRDVHEIVGIDRGQLCPAMPGLSLAESQDDHRRHSAGSGGRMASGSARLRDCGNRRPLKGHRPIVFRTPFRQAAARQRTGPGLSMCPDLGSLW